MIEKFEDLNVWNESVELSVNVYKLLKDCKDFGLWDQIQRSSVSIASNIAEGYERTNKEFVHFLIIAKGSCAELRTQIFIAKEVGIISKNHAEDLIERTKKISAMLSKYIKVRKTDFK